MNVLVTGGSGFIGRYFHQALIAAGHKVTILDLAKPTWDAGPSRVVVGDVRDPAAVRQALTGCDAILNLAAAHHDFGIARETFFSVNEGGARVLCAAAEEAAPPPAVLRGTPPDDLRTNRTRPPSSASILPLPSVTISPPSSTKRWICASPS